MGLCLALLACPASAAAQSGPPAFDPDPWVGPDKAAHFGVSLGLAGGGYGLGALVTQDFGGRLALGASLAIALGLGKEVADALGLGRPSWKDFTWDVIGTAAGLGVAVTFDLALRGVPKAPAPAKP